MLYGCVSFFEIEMYSIENYTYYMLQYFSIPSFLKF